MCAFDFKFGFIVIEFEKSFEIFCRVAGAASLFDKFRVELIFVRSLMAVDTKVFVERFKFIDFIFAFPRMTFCTVESDMAAGEFKASLIVIKCGASGLSKPVVGHMAFGTFLR